jgi:hypothetical protein
MTAEHACRKAIHTHACSGSLTHTHTHAHTHTHTHTHMHTHIHTHTPFLGLLAFSL